MSVLTGGCFQRQAGGRSAHVEGAEEAMRCSAAPVWRCAVSSACVVGAVCKAHGHPSDAHVVLLSPPKRQHADGQCSAARHATPVWRWPMVAGEHDMHSLRSHQQLPRQNCAPPACAAAKSAWLAIGWVCSARCASSCAVPCSSSNVPRIATSAARQTAFTLLKRAAR